MPMRHQLPVASPVQLSGIMAGLLPSARALPELTSRLKASHGAESVVLTGSGTVALALCYLAAAPPGEKPRIALPAWACPDLMSAADAVDAGVVLYDLDPQTLGPDLSSIRQALATGVHAIVVAHWFGLPVDLAELRILSAASGAWIIDDAAQAVGTSIGGRPAGTLGDIGILSFGRGKGRTGGAGGAVLAATPEAAHRLHGVASTLRPPGAGVMSLAGLVGQWALGRPALYWIPAGLPWLHLGETVYHPAPALRGMPARGAAVVLNGWNRADEEVAIRRALAARWSAAVSNLEGMTAYRVPHGSEAGWLRFPIRVRPPGYAALLSPVARRLGIAPGYPKGLWELPLAQGRMLGSGSHLGASSLCRALVTLPTHSLISTLDFAHLLTLVQSL